MLHRVLCFTEEQHTAGGGGGICVVVRRGGLDVPGVVPFEIMRNGSIWAVLWW